MIQAEWQVVIKVPVTVQKLLGVKSCDFCGWITARALSSLGIFHRSGPEVRSNSEACVVTGTSVPNQWAPSYHDERFLNSGQDQFYKAVLEL